jgi:hypothetical protein
MSTSAGTTTTTTKRQPPKRGKRAPVERPTEGPERPEKPIDDASLRKRSIDRWENEGGRVRP